MRLLGNVLILSGCLGLGVWYRDQFIGRIHILWQLENLLELFCSEIRYGKAELPECCKTLERRMAEPFKSCLHAVWEKLQDDKGLAFSEVFRQQMGECLEKLPVQKQECDIFLSALEGGGFADEKMQLRRLEQAGEQLKKIGTQLEREQREKCRMAVGLGVMGGLLLVIVLL